MEESRMPDWGDDKDLDSDFHYDEAFLDFDLGLEENASLIPSDFFCMEQDLMQELVSDKIFSDLSSNPTESPCDGFSSMEENLIDVILVPIEEDIMVGAMEDSEDLRANTGFSLPLHFPTQVEDCSAGNKSISNETASVNTSASLDCDWSATSLIPCSTDSEEYRGLRLVHLLTACADAISDGGHDLVEIILCRLKELVSPTGSTMQRVAYYLYQSLQQHHQPSGHTEGHVSRNCNSTKHPNYLGAFSLLNQVYPYIRFAHFTANQSILEAIPVGAQTVHIIDFDIMEGMQWPPLMEALKSENYKIGHLKITAVKWNDDEEEEEEEEEENDDDDDDSASFSSCWKHTGRRLCEYASSVGIPFSFQEAQLENVKSIRGSNEEEIVIVNCMWELPHMFERSRKQLLEFLHGARDLNPAILTVGSGPNGIAAHEKLSFLERFAQCLKNLCAVFDSMEAGLADQYGLARAMVESLFMGPMMCRPIKHFDGAFTSVVDIPPTCGFGQGNISENSSMFAKCMVEGGSSSYYSVEVIRQNQLVVRWHCTPLTSISTWRATNLM